MEKEPRNGYSTFMIGMMAFKTNSCAMFKVYRIFSPLSRPAVFEESIPSQRPLRLYLSALYLTQLCVTSDFATHVSSLSALCLLLEQAKESIVKQKALSECTRPSSEWYPIWSEILWGSMHDLMSRNSPFECRVHIHLLLTSPILNPTVAIYQHIT